MTQLQISLPDTANRFLEEQVATGRYRSASDCVLALVEKARIQAAQEKLAELIREGMESGEGVEVTDAYWERFDEKLKAELARRRTA
jgi:putative addiction module CopG family antidote